MIKMTTTRFMHLCMQVSFRQDILAIFVLRSYTDILKVKGHLKTIVASTSHSGHCTQSMDRQTHTRTIATAKEYRDARANQHNGQPTQCVCVRLCVCLGH